ncbi:MAG: translation elongation factor-like protein [Deltaproteobacteria bacterium]
MITHYFPKVRAAVLDVKRPLRIGDPVWIKGKSTDFRQTVASLQIDRKPVDAVRPGQEAGLEVMRDVRPGDVVSILK